MGNVQTAASAHEVPWRQTPSGELVDLGRPFRGPLAQSRLHRTPKPVLGRREAVLLGAFALVLHGAVIYWLSQAKTPVLPVVPPEIPPMTIEFSQPAPPVVETPPPPPEPIVQPVVEPPPPVEDELAVKPPPKPKPKPVVKPPPPKPVAKPVEQPPAPPAPPQPVAAPAPPAPPAPAPVTPASASAGYLRNPAPEYPALAMRRGWEGTVLLRVHVLASGKPGEIQIQKSSGRDSLDEAAVTAVKRWSFVPAKQGDVAQDGWVSVPIDFKIK
ncbi:energy transducer TonB [Pseudomonas capsici]|uniref:Protein TonB n=1 Tax=Pseudomonas capsici TaxID=2810614 RepID=A0ABT3BQR2_9PSED|nr:MULTISPECIES: energy transducer TonB [Pseudomonas]MBN6712555.1 energy transducer TonB [Pseudomonas capsici]MBN6717708.1 energy transducer TonB [Pseudomonas capsici]MBN6723241.1 energy transducer TonB [Pseudomonas capsici]MCV4262494.1 energy transducer TonB [Pseudomonas capsici]MCV4267096.1 energy transducer TonB [Pseudomonas capsici]